MFNSSAMIDEYSDVFISTLEVINSKWRCRMLCLAECYV